jgi:hypothetical protein
MKRWRIMEKGEGYSCGNRPWWPHVCGALGYHAGGSAISYVDLVIFRRIYFRIFEMRAPSYEIALKNQEFDRIGKEMRAATPCP